MTGCDDGVAAWSVIATVVEAAAVVGATVLAGIALVNQWADAKARRKSVDAAISADAYTLRQTLRTWIFSAAHLQAVQQGSGTPMTFGPDKAVEQRLRRAVVAAPRASRAVARAIREAYVLYYRVMAQPPVKSLADLQAKPRSVEEAESDAAVANLQACAERLTTAIDPELRDQYG